MILKTSSGVCLRFFFNLALGTILHEHVKYSLRGTDISLYIYIYLYKYISGLLSQQTIILTIIGLAPLRAHICTSCGCMRDFFIAKNPPESWAYDGSFQWMIGGRGEKMWRVQY